MKNIRSVIFWLFVVGISLTGTLLIVRWIIHSDYYLDGIYRNLADDNDLTIKIVNYSGSSLKNACFMGRYKDYFCTESIGPGEVFYWETHPKNIKYSGKEDAGISLGFMVADTHVSDFLFMAGSLAFEDTVEVRVYSGNKANKSVPYGISNVLWQRFGEWDGKLYKEDEL